MNWYFWTFLLHGKRKTLADLVERIAQEINIPFTVGGGINSVEDAATIIKSRVLIKFL